MYVILDLDRHLTHLIIISLHFYTDNVKQGSPASTKTVTLFVKPQAGKSHEIEISANSTVDQVKDEMEDLEAVPTSDQRLIFSGKEPDGQTTLSQLGISGWCTAELIVRGVGGVVDNPYAKKGQPAKKGRTYVSPGRRGEQGDRVVNGGRGGRGESTRGSNAGRGRGGRGNGVDSSQQAHGTGRGHVTPPFQGLPHGSADGGMMMVSTICEVMSRPKYITYHHKLLYTHLSSHFISYIHLTYSLQNPKQVANPYAKKAPLPNPYVKTVSVANPYAQKVPPTNPYATLPVNPYANKAPPSNPYAKKALPVNVTSYPVKCFGGMEMDARGVKMESLNGCKYSIYLVVICISTYSNIYN